MFARTLSAVLLIASALYAQNEARFSISARIVDDLDHKGAAGVRVTLTGSTLTGAPPVAFTNDGGGFNFPNLAAGKYRLIVDHPGFLPQGYPEVAVGDTSTLQLGDLVLVKKRPMSGTVKWKDGEPVAGAFVTVMGFRGGHYSRAPNGGTQITNDKGEFIFPGGNPRHYIFFAYVANQGNSDLGSEDRRSVFFPAVSTPEQATILSMRTTPEFNQIHIVLDDTPGGDIEGTVTSAYHPVGTAVRLGLIVPNVSISSYLTVVTTKVGDSFVMRGILYRNYLLTVVPENVQQDKDSFDLYPVAIRPGESALGLKIVATESALLTGKVEIEEADTAPSSANANGAVPLPKLSPPPQFAFQFEVGDLQSYGLVPAATDREGNFRGTAVVRGLPYKLSPGMNLPCQCYLARMTQGDKDLSAGALPVVGGGDPFRMVLRKDGGSAEGKVSENNKIPNKAFVVLAPRKREVEYWYRKAFTLPDGSFKLTNIAPGDYDLFAFDRDEDTQYLDPNFLAKYVGSAVPVTVQASTGGSYDLKMVRIP